MNKMNFIHYFARLFQDRIRQGGIFVKAQLILENGKCFTGEMFGKTKNVSGEIIFTTGMVGYQEIITDPAYRGQIVVMTFPLIGNYGINLEDVESKCSKLSALIVREKCDTPSNFRCEMSLDDYLKEQGICGLYGIDTRSLTKIIRDNGTMKGVIVKLNTPKEEIENLMSLAGSKDAIKETTEKAEYIINNSGKYDVALLDMGSKDTLIEGLIKADCKIKVYPEDTLADVILEGNHKALFISDGAGNPENAKVTIENVKKLLGKIPMAGISLGHQIIALALGAKIEKLKFGHHGANQPVKDMTDGKVYVTCQNHNYVICDIPQDITVTYENVNDKSIEGFDSLKYRAQGVQFLPETLEGGLTIEKLFAGVWGEVK